MDASQFESLLLSFKTLSVQPEGSDVALQIITESIKITDIAIDSAGIHYKIGGMKGVFYPNPAQFATMLENEAFRGICLTSWLAANDGKCLEMGIMRNAHGPYDHHFVFDNNAPIFKIEAKAASCYTVTSVISPPFVSFNYTHNELVFVFGQEICEAFVKVVMDSLGSMNRKARLEEVDKKSCYVLGSGEIKCIDGQEFLFIAKAPIYRTAIENALEYVDCLEIPAFVLYSYLVMTDGPYYLELLPQLCKAYPKASVTVPIRYVGEEFAAKLKAVCPDNLKLE